jgi:acyl-CoA synthetase (AMP-forming)/AMP-acid ligase II
MMAISTTRALDCTGNFDGYTDPQATKKKILTDVFEKGDQWFRTGDLLARDSLGYFYFVDRYGVLPPLVPLCVRDG